MIHLGLRSIAIIMILLFVASSALFYYLLDDYYEQEAFKRIEQVVQFDKALQHYINDVQKPTIFALVHAKQLPKDYFDPTLLSSTFIANNVNDYYVNDHTKSRHSVAPVRIKFASDNPTNSRNSANAYEKSILERFRVENLEDFRDHVYIDQVEHLFYAMPVSKNTKACLQCHGDPQDAPSSMLKLYNKRDGFYENENHLRAIVAIYTPINSDKEAMLFFFWTMEGVMLAVFGLIYYLIFYYSRMISQKDALIARQSRFAAMGEMIGMIAHQWRQPLSGMGMTINNLKLDIELSMIDEKKWESQLEVLEKQIAYLSQTIDDFRNFFKPNQTLSEVNIKELINGSLGVIASTLKSHNIDIEMIGDGDIVIKTARNDLMQVILNLIKNSIDAYVENKIIPSVVKITLHEEDEWVKVYVQDDAGGIKEEIIHEIFNPYFSTKDEKNGTGLGLYMSKMIVEGHLGGQLNVSSHNGSTEFIVALPKGKMDGN